MRRKKYYYEYSPNKSRESHWYKEYVLNTSRKSFSTDSSKGNKLDYHLVSVRQIGGRDSSQKQKRGLVFDHSSLPDWMEEV